jgi:hypothetical protein
MARDEETTYREGVKETLDRIEEKVDAVDKKVTYTNGKVRKLTLAIAVVAALAVGMGLNNGSFILSLLGL